MSFRATLFVLITCLAGWSPCWVHAADLPRWNVGIVLDGPWKRESQVKALELMKREILVLTEGEFDVRFPEDKKLHGGWTLSGVNRALDKLLQDPTVDIVLALGVVASGEVARRKTIPKPVLAPVVIGIQPGLPYDEGVSGKKNLNYLYSFNKTPSDVLLLNDLVKFKRLAFVMEPLTASVLQRYEMNKLLRQIPTEEMHIVPADGTPDEIVAQIPNDTDAVLFGAVFQWNEADVARFAELLIERQLPSLSIMGGQEVHAGLLAATTTESDVLRLIRRIAINMQRILLGEDPGEIEVEFVETVRPVINMRTAHALGLSPSFDLMNSSDLIGDPDTADYEPLNFRGAVIEALEQNLGLARALQGLEAEKEAIAIARADFLPQLELSLGERAIDPDRAEANNGGNPQYVTTASLRVRQVLYAEPVWANLYIQRLLQQAREHGYAAQALDVTLDTSLAYLDLLRAQELARIRRQDFSFTKSNLERARTRVQIGAASRAEEYRWESQLAEARVQLVRANVAISQARVSLSRLLNRDLETRYRAESPTIDDPYFLVSNKRFLQYITTPAAVRVLREFLVQEGLRGAPEIQQAETAISAQERAVTSARRRFTHPRIGLEGEVSQILGRRGAGLNPQPINTPLGAFTPENNTDNTVWQVGLSAVLPIYQGGSRSAGVRREVAELGRLQTQRDEIRQGLHTQILVNTYGAGGAFTNIQNAREQHEAARSNLALVTDAYSRGAVSIIDLLDAQSAAVNAESAAANSIYNFLIEFMRLQRAMGNFDFLMTDEQRAAIYDRMDAFFSERGIEPAELDPTG